MYRQNNPFMTELDTMLAMSPQSNQYPMAPPDNIMGGYGSMGSLDKVLTMLAGSLADLEGTAIDTEKPQTLPYQKMNRPITNEDLETLKIPKVLQNPDFDVTIDNNGRWFYKRKGTSQWNLYVPGG